MKRLNELQSLVKLAQNFGQDPDSKILAEIKYLQEQQDKKLKQQNELKARVRSAYASLELFEAPAKEYKRPSKYPDGKAIPASLPDLYQPADNAGVPKNQRCDNCEFYIAESKKCTRWNNAVVKPAYWCAKWDAIVAKKQTEEVQIVQPETSVDLVSNYIKESTVVGPEPVLAQPTPVLEQKVKQLEAWISRIAATGPGGGAGDVINLDYPVKTITTSSYTILRKDHYIGVNVGTSTTIVLPTTGTKQGRNLIIKDESGHCSKNRITLTGTVDADTSGAILAIDNGALHLIYNNGWRIV
jgi:hypothetical protein